jgi:hypothetical protein
VPAFYLRRFASDQEQVRVVARDASKAFTTSAEKAATERDFYAVETVTGELSQKVETFLGERIEGPGAEALVRMVGGGFPPTQEDRERLAVLFALQFLRGRDLRSVVDHLSDRLTKLLLRMMPEREARRQLKEYFGQEPTAEELMDIIRAIADVDSYQIAPHANEYIHLLLEGLEPVTRVMYMRSWRLVHFAPLSLLTTDRPVLLWTDPEKLRRAGFWGRGIGVATADQIWIPLDPCHMLFLLHPEPDGDRQAQDQCDDVDEIQALNTIQATHAFEWIYHHPGHDPLAGLKLPPQQPIARVGLLGGGR